MQELTQVHVKKFCAKVLHVESCGRDVCGGKSFAFKRCHELCVRVCVKKCIIYIYIYCFYFIYLSIYLFFIHFHFHIYQVMIAMISKKERAVRITIIVL